MAGRMIAATLIKSTQYPARTLCSFFTAAMIVKMMARPHNGITRNSHERNGRKSIKLYALSTVSLMAVSRDSVVWPGHHFHDHRRGKK